MGHFFRFLVSKVFIINLLLAIILVGGGIYATLRYLDDYTNHDELLKVPNLNDKHISEVDDLLESATGFTAIVTDSVYKIGTRGGTVLEQTPKADKTVKQGRKIYLTLAASKPPQIAMPKLVDRSLRQATSLMETYGLELGELIYKPDMCTNCILEQQINGKKIEAGERIRRGSTIDLVVGQGLGTELTPVPYLVDFTAEMAENLLQSKSLNLGALLFDETVETAEDSANAKVYKQMPFYSQAPSVRMGTSVDLFLTLDTNKVVFTVNPSDSI